MKRNILVIVGMIAFALIAAFSVKAQEIEVPRTSLEEVFVAQRAFIPDLEAPNPKTTLWVRDCHDQRGTKRWIQFHVQAFSPDQPSWWIICDHQGENGFFYNVWEQSCWAGWERAIYLEENWGRVFCIHPG